MSQRTEEGRRLNYVPIAGGGGAEDSGLSGRAPRVSIGMPVFNGEKFMCEALDSALNQTFKDFEVVISDNASTDRTEEICRSYVARDKRVRYFRNAHNLGAAKNYNRVFALSRGEYFKWLASDDAIEPTFIEKCVELLDSDPEMVLACSNYFKLELSEPREIQPAIATYPAEHFHDLMSPRANVRFRKLWAHPTGDSVFMPIFGLIRSSALRRTQLIRPFVDSECPLLVDLVLKGKYGYIHEQLKRIGTHPNSYHRLHNRSKEGMRGEAETQWFDPENGSKAVAFYWRRLWEFSKLILKSDATGAGKLRMMAYLVYPIAYWWRIMLLKETFFTVGAGRFYTVLRNSWHRMKTWHQQAGPRVSEP